MVVSFRGLHPSFRVGPLMGITLPYTFVSGQPRLASEVNANAEACRAWLNGQINTADIANSTLRSENILKPEHYGSPSYRSLAVSEDVYYDAKTGDSANQDDFCREAGIDEYVLVPGASRTVTVLTTSRVIVSARFYAKFFPSQSTFAGYLDHYVAGYVRLYIGGTPKDSTRRRIQRADNGNDLTTSFQEEWDYTYRIDYSIIYSEQLSAGKYDIWLGARALPHALASSGYALEDDSAAGIVTPIDSYSMYMSITSRTFRVEVHALT